MKRHLGRRRLLATLCGGSFLGVALYEMTDSERHPRNTVDIPDASLLDVMIAGRLRIGIDPSYPPFEFITAENHFAGLDVALATTISEGIGVTLQPLLVGLDGFYDALRARKIDAAISSIVPGPKAGKDMAFSLPYFNAGLVFCVGANGHTTNPLTSHGVTIAVELGSEGEEYLTRHGIPARRISRTEDIKEAFASLVTGNVQAVLTDVPTAALLRRQITGFIVLEPAVTHKPYAIACRATDYALLHSINQQIETMKQHGELQQITDRWL